MTIEATLDEVLGAAPDVATAYLYGSAAGGALRPDSDIDVGVVFAATASITGFEACQRLEEAIERRTGRRADVIDLERAPIDLVQRVLRGGVLVLDRDPARRVRFEVRRLNEWFDMEPLLRAYRRAPGPA